jgi:hypothetical protein
MQIEEPLPEEKAKKVMVNVPDDDDLQNWFTYHPPGDDDIPKYKDIRDAGLSFARVIDKYCPNGADKSVAIRKVREAVMNANASIACCRKD